MFLQLQNPTTGTLGNTFLLSISGSSFQGRVTVSGELMLLESYGNFDVTNK